MKSKFLLIDEQDCALVGRSTPDPLRFAFSRKQGPHVGGKMHMVAADQVQSELANALALTSASSTTESAVNKPRCLYVHIPFCRVRCSYCNFFQYASVPQMMDDYFAALLAEIKWKSAQPWTQLAPFQAVYVGGGTPTDLSAAQLQQLGQVLRTAFPLTPDCEITLEGRVNRFSEDKFEAALAGGFNRFSFGVQSFDTQVRRAAKRLDDGDVVIERLQQMLSYNSAPIVIDLLYGLPYQTLDNWQRDLQTYLELGLDGVDLYQLIEMQGLPMELAVKQGKLPPPADTAMKASMYQLGVEFMAQHHQRRLSVNHWASGNRERSIYNSLAKTTAEVFPLGAGAGGNFGGLNIMQSRDMDMYLTAIKQQQFPVMAALYSAPDAALSSVIKAGFDCGVLARRELNKAAGYDLYHAATPLFSAWQQNGLVKFDQDYLALTLAGQFWTTTLAQNLIQTIQQ